MSTKEIWKNELKEHQLKVTKGRISVLEELALADQPISAEDLHDLLRNKHIGIDLSTIYRSLELFTEANLVNKISIFEDGRKLFALQSKKHCHYLVCKKCKKILTINSCPIEAYAKELEEKTGFSIDGHSLYLYGICDTCQK